MCGQGGCRWGLCTAPLPSAASTTCSPRGVEHGPSLPSRSPAPPVPVSAPQRAFRSQSISLNTYCTLSPDQSCYRIFLFMWSGRGKGSPAAHPLLGAGRAEAALRAQALHPYHQHHAAATGHGCLLHQESFCRSRSHLATYLLDEHVPFKQTQPIPQLQQHFVDRLVRAVFPSVGSEWHEDMNTEDITLEKTGQPGGAHNCCRERRKKQSENEALQKGRQASGFCRNDVSLWISLSQCTGHCLRSSLMALCAEKPALEAATTPSL